MEVTSVYESKENKEPRKEISKSDGLTATATSITDKEVAKLPTQDNPSVI